MKWILTMHGGYSANDIAHHNLYRRDAERHRDRRTIILLVAHDRTACAALDDLEARLPYPDNAAAAQPLINLRRTLYY